MWNRTCLIEYFSMTASYTLKWDQTFRNGVKTIFYKQLIKFPFIPSTVKQASIDRSSHPEVFCKEGVLRNYAKFIGKYLCQSLFFNKVAGLRLAILLKKRLWHRCLPLNFCKVSKNTLIEHLRKTASKCCRRFLFKEFSKVTPRALERNLGTWSMFL